MSRTVSAAGPRANGRVGPHVASLAYNPALDGLRGVAIIAVVIYHLFDGALPGGFVGVDLFFVLSAFLITTLLLDEVDDTGGLNIGSFYVRRVRRLAPALLTMLLTVAAYGLLWADELELSRLKRHVFGAITYSANWMFIADGTTYVDMVAGQSPLRHVWSLAIEEQFYLVVPLALLVAARLGNRASRNRRLVLVSSALLGASVWQMNRVFAGGAGASRAYFGTDARIFAMLIGMVIAAARQSAIASGRWIPLQSGRRPALQTGDSSRSETSPRWPPAGAQPWNVAASAGAILFVALAITAGETTPWMYPTGFVGVALASAALVLGAERSPWERRVLQAPILIVLGQISYGLYLWHWPIRVLLDADVLPLSGVALGVAQLVLSLVVSIVSYRFLETPIRRQRWHWASDVFTPTQAVIGGCLALLVVAMAALPGSVWASAVSQSSIPKDAPSWYSDITPESAGGPRVVMVGDSVAHTLAGGEVGQFPNFTPWTPDQQPVAASPFEVYSVAQPGCSLIGPTAQLDASGQVQSVALDGLCVGWRSHMKALIGRSRPDVVMVGLSNDLYDHAIDGTFVRLDSSGGKTLIFELLDEVRTVASGSNAELVLLALPPRSNNDAVANDLDRGGWREAKIADYYAEYAQRHDNVAMVDVRDLVCGDDTCSAGTAGFQADWRYDGLHFTSDGTSAFWNWVLPRLQADGGS